MLFYIKIKLIMFYILIKSIILLKKREKTVIFKLVIFFVSLYCIFLVKYILLLINYLISLHHMIIIVFSIDYSTNYYRARSIIVFNQHKTLILIHLSLYHRVYLSIHSKKCVTFIKKNNKL
jgi:hypothetical protein